MARIKRSIHEPVRIGLTWDQRWKGADRGLIACWEAGRELAAQERARDGSRVEGDAPPRYVRAEQGELVVLAWKGGADRKLKVGHKYGPLNYLAMWQGLRGDDLDIDPEGEITLTCTRTGMSFTYTPDASKYVVKDESTDDER